MYRRCALVGLILTAILSLALPAQALTPARRALKQTLPDTKFTGVALGDCISYLGDVTGANIFVDWKALDELNVTPDTPVNMRLRNVSMGKVLSLMLSEAGAGDALTYYVDEGVIHITTVEKADQRLYVRIYPVDDLLMEIPDFAGPDLSLSDSTGGNGTGGGGQSIFEDQQQDDDEESTTKTERAEKLIALICDVIRPDVWVDNGGVASIRYFNGSLIVRAPQSVHEMLGGVRD